MTPLDRLDPYHLKRGLERVNELVGASAVTRDLGFLRRARRTLLPLPVVDRQRTIRVRDVFPGRRRRRPPHPLARKRVALVASGGSGAAVGLVGVARAFEEAGIEPALISACSGGAIWGAMWAGGMSSDEMADFSLAWRPEDYLDVRWLRVPKLVLSGLKGFTGLAKGEAIERLFDARLYGMSAGETVIPFTTIVWNMDLGRIEYFGSRETPEVPVGELVRIAIALPLFIESVPVRGHLYVDGGIVDVFPAEPALDPSFERVIGVNFMLPRNFAGEDITGWHDRPAGILRASRQLQQGGQLELARRNREQLGDRLTLIDATDSAALHGVAFYDLFLDREKWPGLMRTGYERATAALDALR